MTPARLTSHDRSKSRTSLVRKSRKGFTLIELLLVIGIIAILAAVVIVAINPTKQLGDARNAQRSSDVNTIISAVYQYSIDSGNLPSSIPVGTALPTCQTGAASCNHGVNLSVLTASGKYLVAIPTDPQVVSGTGTNYTIMRNTSGRVLVTAPGAEGIVISVTR